MANIGWVTSKLEDIVRGKKMYKCEICGREIFKKNRAGGYTLCSRHMHQFCKYGKFLDTNPRTQNDLNAYVIQGKKAIFEVYNQKGVVVDHFIIDKQDLERVKYHKWRIDTNKHVITGNCSKTRPRKELSHIILGEVPGECVVDHINHDPRDNRRDNLRVCKQSDNVCNKGFMSTNTSGWIGVYRDKKRNKWSVEIVKNGIRYRLGRYSILEEAVFIRVEAEKILFQEYRPTNKDKEYNNLVSHITDERKQELQKIIHTKLSRQ